MPPRLGYDNGTGSSVFGTLRAPAFRYCTGMSMLGALFIVLSLAVAMAMVTWK